MLQAFSALVRLTFPDLNYLHVGFLRLVLSLVRNSVALAQSALLPSGNVSHNPQTTAPLALTAVAKETDPFSAHELAQLFAPQPLVSAETVCSSLALTYSGLGTEKRQESEPPKLLN
jgi:hypothetical protein